MNFAEKNNFVIKHADSKEFFKDLELFKKHFPNDRLNHDLARANSITYQRLDGSMLFRLLDKISPDEILANRNPEEEKEKEETVIPEKEETVIPEETNKKKDKNKTNSQP
jgi:hypothetical protein